MSTKSLPAEHDNYPNKPMIILVGAFVVTLGLLAGAIIGIVYMILWLAQVK